MSTAIPPSARAATLIFGILVAAGLASCDLAEPRLATIWTDVPEIALYAEVFNRDQERYRVEVVWKDDIAKALRDARSAPDLAIASYLKSSEVSDRFRPLDYLFGELAVDQSAFYPTLLSFCKSNGQQVLLPLSFNLPAIVSSKEAGGGEDPRRTVGLDDLATASASFDRKKGSGYSQMGFSPRWSPEFLVIAASAGGGGFREGKPLSWSDQGLRTAMARLRSWGGEVAPTAVQADDFQFKYLFTPEYTWLTEGRARFAYLESSKLFVIPEEKAEQLDFAWYAEGGSIPVLEDLVCLGIPKSRKSSHAAEHFIGWLFNAGRQQEMLEFARRTRSLESTFGIAGGFSAIREVTEKAFPLYYSALRNRLPPAEMIGAPTVLPVQWPAIKSAVLAPWLREVLSKPVTKTTDYGADLTQRLSDWSKYGKAVD